MSNRQEELQRSVEELSRLRTNSLVSIVLMILGIGIVAGSMIYSANTLDALSDKKAKAEQDLEDLKKEKGEVSKEMDDLLKEKKRVLKDLEFATGEVGNAQENLDDKLAENKILESQNEILRRTLGAVKSEEDKETRVRKADATLKATEPVEIELKLEEAVKNLYSVDRKERLAGYTRIMEDYEREPTLVDALLNEATDSKNEDGIYNTLVVLSYLEENQRVKEKAEELKALAARVRGMGALIAKRADIMLDRLDLE